MLRFCSASQAFRSHLIPERGATLQANVKRPARLPTASCPLGSGSPSVLVPKSRHGILSLIRAGKTIHNLCGTQVTCGSMGVRQKGGSDMLIAGASEQITWDDDNWLFLDVGFSASSSSSGLLVGNGNPCAVQFGEARRRILDHIRHANSPTNLVIEAPLSVCFNRNGNPTGRLIERDSIEGKTQTRYWHAGLGCSVMVAAMYIIRGSRTPLPLVKYDCSKALCPTKIVP